MKDNKYDIRLALLCQHKENVHALVLSGYYSKVKHLIDRYVDNGEYLIDVELFSNLIILRYVSPNDGFKTILLDKVEF
jgi:hypothetical protein